MASVKMTCIDDAAYIEQAEAQAESIIAEAVVWAAIQTAIMLAQRSARTGLADIQSKLGERRVKLAEEMLAHAKETWPEVQRYVSDAMSEAYHEPVYSETQPMLTEVDRIEDATKLRIESVLGRLGITATVCDDARVGRGFATVRTDLTSHTMRSSEARAIALNDRRYSRQLAAVGLGRRVLNAAMSMSQLTGGANTVRTSLLRTINSATSLWGYSANRWSHGSNHATGPRGAANVIPQGWTAYQTGGAPGGDPVVYMRKDPDDFDISSIATTTSNTALSSIQRFSSGTP